METGMKTHQWVVLGLGASGRSAVRFLLERGGRILGVDDNLLIDAELQSFVERGVFFANSCPLNQLQRATCLVKSPGISLAHPLAMQAKASGVPIVCDVELVAQTFSGPSIGVTGTNGKTTVALLIEHILYRSGKIFQACGNIGLPIADAARNLSCQGLVVELSSYQLETLDTPFLDVALLLNITPNHLDRHFSFEEYRKAKLKIFSLLKTGGRAIAHRSIPLDSEEGVLRFGGFHGNLPTELCSMYHPHDLDNMEAARLVCKHFGLSDNQIANALFTFKKPPHRIEFVCKVGGISFYNDSKGTNVDAVKKAVEAMNGEVVLIAGGVDKGFSYVSWRDSFSDKVKMICAIGQAASKIASELGAWIPVQVFEGLHAAVAHAIAISKTGGNVLLSPGCASFDMFRDYGHRGNEFKRIVQLLTIGE